MQTSPLVIHDQLHHLTSLPAAIKEIWPSSLPRPNTTHQSSASFSNSISSCRGRSRFSASSHLARTLAVATVPMRFLHQVQLLPSLIPYMYVTCSLLFSWRQIKRIEKPCRAMESHSSIPGCHHRPVLPHRVPVTTANDLHRSMPSSAITCRLEAPSRQPFSIHLLLHQDAVIHVIPQ
jgi:hypothetical protein